MSSDHKEAAGTGGPLGVLAQTNLIDSTFFSLLLRDHHHPLSRLYLYHAFASDLLTGGRGHVQTA